MTKGELIEKIHESHSETLTKKVVGEIVDHLFTNLAVAIRKESRFSYPQFGTFSVKKRKARKGRNPQTGAVIDIPSSKTVGFKPSPTLKKSV
jgi:DNA-binding protein HU-beta